MRCLKKAPHIRLPKKSKPGKMTRKIWDPLRFLGPPNRRMLCFYTEGRKELVVAVDGVASTAENSGAPVWPRRLKVCGVTKLNNVKSLTPTAITISFLHSELSSSSLMLDLHFIFKQNNLFISIRLQINNGEITYTKIIYFYF